MPSTFADHGSNVSGLVPSSATNPVDSVLVLNLNTAARYFQLFDLGAPPTTGTAPLHSFMIPGMRDSTPSQVCMDAAYFTATPYVFMNGIAWGFSTSGATFQPASLASDGSVEMEWG